MTNTQNSGNGCLEKLVAGAGALMGGGGGGLAAYLITLPQKCEYIPKMPSACVYDSLMPIAVITGTIMGAIIVGSIAGMYAKSVSK